ncbi:MAG: YihY/virulence factor BrkB family protein [Mitsuaria chitosanitabida]|uniref:YihY/virulence factor BrkB family protein n=1 Tax=Roseateles chitosanitabidus TaxID=65048 RepID=UPI001B1E97DE|nr:YihY/virulence factor BrkB family protein [Roseateles chitosanitabidus]MBO9687803.1 YihY/virulence factor BrkB family protein [Roseateles chitosanitabidus]
MLKLPAHLQEAVEIVRDAAQGWSDDNAPSMGAALAYYTLFSIAPLLLIVIAVAGLVFGEQAARGEVMEQLSGLVGLQGAMAVEDLLKRVNRPEEGGWAAVIGTVVLLIGATSVFAELQNALNRIWKAPQVRSGPVWHGLLALARKRLLSLGLILGLGFLSMVSMVASAALAAASKWWTGWLGADFVLLAQILNGTLAYALITVMFAVIYKWVPDVPVRWRDVWVGALITSALFSLGKALIGLYIGRSGVSSAYGAAASLVVMMLWVYYSTQVFLMGAELSWAFAKRHSLREQAAHTAERTLQDA